MAKADARKLLFLGIAGSAFTLFQLSRLNLSAGYWDFFWPQFIQGVALALLFVPLTTTTMDSIPNAQMGNATSIFNLMRNIGGGVGIAASTTMVARAEQANINRLGERFNAFNPQAGALMGGLRNTFMAGGSGYVTASRQAYVTVFRMVEGQAAILSFVRIFRLLALIFLAVIPVLLLMKRPARRRVTAPH